jgi:2-enoate reductase
MSDLSEQQIEAMMDLYVRASARAATAGFDAVTLQMTHGWPLSRFASPLTNDRNDKYGDYSYVGAETIRRIKAAVGKGIAVIPRFSIIEDRMGQRGVTLKQSVEQLAPAYEDAGADMLDLSFGLGPIAKTAKDYWATEMLYIPPGDKFDACRAVKQAVTVPVAGRSGINHPDLARRAVLEGAMDIVGLGRQLLADPEFPRKMQEGEEASIVRCIRCQFCGRVTVGGRAVMQPLHCAVNGAMGRETVWNRARPNAKSKTIAVIGAGPAGLQAALSLAEYGCNVIVYERGDSVGGLLRQAAKMPKLLMSDLQYAVDDLYTKLRTTSADIRLNTVFDESLAEGGRFDAVVLATGSTPESSPDDGLSRSFTAYLSGDALGRRVVVDGRGEGAEYAVSLARTGHEVTLVEASSKLEPTKYDYAVKRVDALEDYLQETGVRIFLRSRVVRAEPGRVTVEGRNGSLTVIEADSVLRAGRTSCRLDTKRLRRCASVVIEIGDCVKPRGLGEAMEEGRMAAVSIAADSRKI